MTKNLVVFENGSNVKVDCFEIVVYGQFESVFNKRGIAFTSGDSSSEKSAQDCLVQCLKASFENRSKITATKLAKLRTEDCNVQ